MKAFNPLLPHLRLDNEEDNFPSLFPVTEFSVLKMLSTLNARKATGPDGIPAWVLKENADILASSVADIINSSYKEAHLPESWKKADITPIPKQKPVRDVNKHLRPILLTAIVSKVAEEFVVENYVKPAVLKRIDSNQHGAIPKSSTTIALLSMLQSWNKATDGNGAAVRVLLLDFKKAFDLIDHHLLVEKLRLFDIPKCVLNWIVDFLSGRKQRVKLKHDCFSAWELVPAGVPHARKLGPWLFLIMINDLKLQNEMWKFVDDTTVSEVIGKDQTSDLQNQMDIFENSISSDKFQLNETKCKEMIICFGSNVNDFQPITINNITVDIVQNAKVLGLHIANNLKGNIHVNEVIKKCRKRLYHLTQLKRANIGLKELLQFYKSCTRPVLEYACPVFHNSLTLYLSNDLESVQKRALKIILPHHNYENALPNSQQLLCHLISIMVNFFTHLLVKLWWVSFRVYFYSGCFWLVYQTY
jgi:hypothetical protein